MVTKNNTILFFILSLSFFASLCHGRLDTSPFVANLHAYESLIYPQEGVKERDKIDKLPGQPNVKFNQYGGYVTVNHTAGRALYYYFVEAEKDKDYLPLLLWLNGGPGCSSLGFGAMEELGPFRVYSDGKTLYRNSFAWNQVANVLFLESPAGVGFSYSNTTSDVTSNGDKRTASDNYVFLLNWLERFPEFKNREFYISGESYAGHYVPELANIILHQNKMDNKTLINLRGISIGNGIINNLTDLYTGRYDYWGSHALISEETLFQIKKYCDFYHNVTVFPVECINALNEANNDVANINTHNIYAPLCLSPNLTAKPKKASVLNFDECSNHYVHAYMNRPEVQEALHANVTQIPYDWKTCSSAVKSNWRDSPSTVIPLIREVMENGLRVLIYSGDVDGLVPVTSTQYSINTMKLPVKIPWYSWVHNGEVGGYTQVYKGGLIFATVRGGGHEVPSYSPQRALSLIKHYLNGISLPNTNSTHN